MNTIKDWTKKTIEFVKADPKAAALYFGLGIGIAITADAVINIVKESKTN